MSLIPATPKEQRQDPFGFLPPPMRQWTLDWVKTARQEGVLPADIMERQETELVILGTMLATADYLLSCSYMDLLQIHWSVIEHDDQAFASAWRYDPDSRVVTFEPSELSFWKIAQGKNGQSVLGERIEKLGRYSLDPDEEGLGLRYCMEMVRRLGGPFVGDWERLIRVSMWATLMWVLSDSGWNFLLEAGHDGKPRHLIAYGISCLPTPEQPLGFSTTLARFGRMRLPDDNQFLLWGTLLHPDKLTRIGESVSCVSCGQAVHCLIRVAVLDDHGHAQSVHLCSRCRELTYRSGRTVDTADNIPEEEGGTGTFSDYPCLRFGDTKRPYCEVSKTCKWNEIDGLVARTRATVQENVHTRLRQLERGEHPIVQQLVGRDVRGLLGS